MQTTTSDGGKAMPRTFVQGAAPSSELQQCITNCMTCSAVCEQTLQYCIKQGGKHAEAQHVSLLRDCVDICELSAHFMLRGSQRHATTCRACAEICAACATACDAMGDDAVMKQCAEVCRTCAASCRNMAAS
jgi:hypothetical protein